MSLTAQQAQKLREAILVAKFEAHELKAVVESVWEELPEQLNLNEAPVVVAHAVVDRTDAAGPAFIDRLTQAIINHRLWNAPVRVAIDGLRAELALLPLPLPPPLPPMPPPDPAPRESQPFDSYRQLLRIQAVLADFYPRRGKLIAVLDRSVDMGGKEYEDIVDIPDYKEELLRLVHWLSERRNTRLIPLLAAVMGKHPDSPELVNLIRELSAG